MEQSKVQFYDPMRGFGFIDLPGQKLKPGEEPKGLYVGRYDIVDERYTSLVPTEPVEFEIASSSQGPKAIKVRSLLEGDRHRGRVFEFSHTDGHGYIEPDDHSGRVEVSFKDIIGSEGKMREQTLEEDEPVEYELETTGSGKRSALRVKRLNFVPVLHRWAYMGKLDDWLAELAKLADDTDEDEWKFPNKNPKYAYPVLKSYLEYTFKQLLTEHRGGAKTIIEKDGLAVFNTGLETDLYSQIYAVFKLNDRKPSARYPWQPKWKLLKFCIENYKLFAPFVAEPPERATYFTDPKVLVFDTRKRLIVNKPHIARERLGRFPPHISEAEISDADKIDLAIKHLDTECDKAIERVRRNYKIAVPQFYHGEVQLLLPISLSPRRADLALAATLVNNDHYNAHTALDLDQAYGNARLLTRPDKDWLRS